MQDASSLAADTCGRVGGDNPWAMTQRTAGARVADGIPKCPLRGQIVLDVQTEVAGDRGLVRLRNANQVAKTAAELPVGHLEVLEERRPLTQCWVCVRQVGGFAYMESEAQPTQEERPRDALQDILRQARFACDEDPNDVGVPQLPVLLQLIRKSLPRPPPRPTRPEPRSATCARCG